MLSPPAMVGISHIKEKHMHLKCKAMGPSLLCERCMHTIYVHTTSFILNIIILILAHLVLLIIHLTRFEMVGISEQVD